MQIENKYVSNHNYNNTVANTTGLVMNNYMFNTHVVNFQFDKNRSSTVGTFSSTFMNLNQSVTIALQGGGGYVSYTNEYGPAVGTMVTSYFPANTLTVNASSFQPGTFYCQYYGYNGDILPPPTVPTTLSTISQTNTASISSTTVVTTTKSSQSKSIIQLFIFGLIFVVSKI